AQGIGVESPGGFAQDCSLVLRVRDKGLFVGHLRVVSASPGADDGRDSRFPVDERAVAVETQRFELSQIDGHGWFSFMLDMERVGVTDGACDRSLSPITPADARP